MKKQLQRFRKLFLRTKKMNATTTRSAMAAYEEEDEGSTRLSSAFIVVLLLHVVAVVGVIAFTRIKENRKNQSALAAATPSENVASPAEAPMDKPALTVASLQPKPEPKAAIAHDSVKPTSSQKSSYTVKPGDNLTKISMAYSVPAADLANANGLKTNEPLQIGQKLEIPERKVTSKPFLEPSKQEPTKTTGAQTYVVKKGDSPVKIARDLGVSPEELVKLNNISDPKKLQPGQTLKVPPKKG